MSVVKRASVRCVVGGGVAAGGWSSAGNALQPGYALPAPVREVALEVAIERDPGGNLLIVTSDDPSIWCDHWFATLGEAEDAAATWYGVRAEDWRTA